MAGITDAPHISGFTPVDLLGAGGFADVYLYEQQMPRRKVAIKVLRDRNLSAAGRQVFESEANVMAELSAHPYIVTVYSASVTMDGRPYLVMEYYPGPSLGRRYRERPLPVDESLRIGVQVCGAAETAHRSGILHRDLKPANILTSAYGRPGLTDFGISVVKGQAATVEGMSVPWSPPELLDEYGEADERSDVYSLAATVYSLLAGRSPFEVPGGRNDAMALTSRIHQDPPARIGRADVPASLERLLQVALSKSAGARPSSALELGRQLQEIEAELRFSRTDIDVLQVLPESPSSRAVPPGGSGGADPDGTRYRAPLTIDAHTQLRRPGKVEEAETRLRARSVDPSGAGDPGGAAAAVPALVEAQSQPSGAGRSRGLLVGALVVSLLAAGGAVALGLSGSAGATDTPTAPPVSVVDPNAEGDLGAPEELSLSRVGSEATASWAEPADWQDGDWYVYSMTGTDEPSGSVRVEDTGPVTVAGVPAEGSVCIKVSHRRDGAQSPFAVQCVE